MATPPFNLTKGFQDNPGSLPSVCLFPDRLITRECSAPIIIYRLTII